MMPHPSGGKPAPRQVGPQVVEEEPEPFVQGEGAHRAEVAAVEREYCIGPVLDRQGNVDRVSQVQVQAWFITQRSQVQILPLLPSSRRSEAPLGNEEGL
jgi:hypothetical protein